MKIKIQNDVPLPAQGPGGAKKTSPVANAMRILNVGQSFFVDQTVAHINKYKFYVELETGFVFTLRTVTDYGVKGCRVWRLK